MAIFRVGVTAPPFSSMVQVFRTMTTLQYLQATIGLITCWALSRPGINTLAVVSIIFYGFFDLDFFRILSPTLCLNLDTIQLTMPLLFGPSFL